MVRVVRREESDDERLDSLLTRLAESHGFTLHRAGWSRKTYDLFHKTALREHGAFVARVESNATYTGEIRVFDDRALAFAEELGGELENGFEVREATILRLPPPS